MSANPPRFRSAGDTALTIELGETADLAQSQRIMTSYRRILAAHCEGIVEIVPAIASLTIHYDPCRTSAARLKDVLSPRLARLFADTHEAPDSIISPSDAIEVEEPALVPSPRRWTIPACYDPCFGPDIAAVASHSGLPPWQVTALHACTAYRVFMLGFLPGHPYLGELPPPLRIPRRNTPRTAVPAGSIAIATTLSVIYPLESPGGWHIIARTPVPMFDPRRGDPSLLSPGDEVRFQPIGAAEFAEMSSAAKSGWRLAPQEATP